MYRAWLWQLLRVTLVLRNKFRNGFMSLLQEIHLKKIAVSFICFYAVAIAPAFSVTVASKEYVDSIIPYIQSSFPPQPDWTQEDSSADDYIQNKPNLATVATSGSYNDLLDVPQYAIKSSEITGAATGASAEVDLGDYIFRTTKQSTANYWNVRIINQTGASARVITKGRHYYSSAVQNTGKDTTLAAGAELNPDVETGDIGYGGDTIYLVEMFDVTNMHLYRVSLSVLATSAIIVAERLH